MHPLPLCQSASRHIAASQQPLQPPLLVLLILLALAGRAVAGEPAERADAIFASTGVRGGLVVHLGCGTGELTAALARGGRNIVHGLSADAQEVAAARAHIRARGLYGPVSVTHWQGESLPYVDHLVNLLVVETPGRIDQEEWLRVLVSGGVAYVNKGSAWTKLVKPARPGADEWTHYLYDASGNPVSRDRLVGPPRHLHWTAGPAHTRSHEYASSIAAVVSSGGRIFYLADEGSTGNLQAAANWQVVARDAHNGVLLWKRPIEQWYTHLGGWTSVPIQLQRRLVAVGERVYVTLGYHAAVSELDAATGRPVRVYEGTDGADEILWHDGVLLVAARSVTDDRLAEFRKLQDLTRRRGGPLHDRETGRPLIAVFNQAENRTGRSVAALDAQTGAELWKLTGPDAAGFKTLSLQACGKRVYGHFNGTLTCRDLASGKLLWSKKADAPHAASENGLVCWSSKAVTLLDPRDGSVHWTQPPTLVSVRDVFITGDSVWIGGFHPFDTGRKHTGPGWGPYFAVERDLATGKVVREIAPENPGHHHRCYISKATERYILGGRRGTEFIDLESGEYLWNSWARGVCRYGVMPANGLLYAPPHSCGCYITARLTGFNALASERMPSGREAPAASPRLEKGPAYGRSSAPPHAEDWPTYRGDSRRSGVAACRVPAELEVKWRAVLNVGLTAPTVACGLVFVADTDRHTLLALDADTGRTVWTFVAGGRIDSPPTIHDGYALLGCCDGFAYALRASDGAVAWRFRGARNLQSISSNGQLESIWPIHGSILVDNNVAYFTAGRSSYLDGGMDLHRLDPRTGEALSETGIYSPDPETGRQPPQYNQNQMPGSRSDILVADDEHVYLRHVPFSKEGVQLDERVPHLFTLTDFLDDSWTHRSYWVFAAESSLATGCSSRDKNLIYGRLLLYDESTICGYARRNVDWSNQFLDGPYRLFARPREAAEPAWSKTVPIHVQAMIRAGDTLFTAGPPAETAERTEPAAKHGSALLVAYAAGDGAELARCELSAPAVFDGLAAARGRLFLALEDGSLLCLGGK